MTQNDSVGAVLSLGLLWRREFAQGLRYSRTEQLRLQLESTVLKAPGALNGEFVL